MALLGDGVAAWLSDKGFKGSVKRLGFPDNFIEHGSRNQLLQDLGLDTDGLVNAVSALVENKAVLI